MRKGCGEGFVELEEEIDDEKKREGRKARRARKLEGLFGRDGGWSRLTAQTTPLCHNPPRPYLSQLLGNM